MSTVHILQRYIPKYRLPFFDAVVDRLKPAGVSVVVFAGSAPAGAARRQDQAPSREWATTISQRSFSVGTRNLLVQFPGPEFFNSDAAIVGLVGTSIPMYRALLSQRLRNQRMGVWGHVRTYITNPNPVDSALEMAVARRADRVFAYTPGGAQFAIEHGVPPERLTTVMNSVDTSGLIEMGERLARVSTLELGGCEWRRGDPTLAYVGGLDRTKRVDFLAASLDHLWKVDKAVRLLVAGSGADEGMLDTAVRRGQVVRLGYADDKVLASMGAVSKGIAMPGRVGLVAVHALALGLPVITTQWPYHAPEFEYLTEGDSAVITGDDPREYAAAMRDTAHAPSSRRNRDYPTMSAMVSNFSEGVLQLLS